jgi:hypothetical protein
MGITKQRVSSPAPVAAEGEDLVDQIAGAVAGLQDLVQVGVDLRVGGL